MSYPERSDIAQLRDIRRKVDDAANNTIAAAAVMSNASDNASYAAVATAAAKRTVDKAYAAAVTKAAEVTAINPSTVATAAPNKPPNNSNDTSARQLSTNPRPPAQPEEDTVLSHLTMLLVQTLFVLPGVFWAAVSVFVSWKILVLARVAVHSLGITDCWLTLFCTVFAASFAMGTWLLLRARGRGVPGSLA